jgi:hypothetical protein
MEGLPQGLSFRLQGMLSSIDHLNFLKIQTLVALCKSEDATGMLV